MRFLVHLLALIAGITGLIAGPAAARASDPIVIASALPGTVEQASESATVRRLTPALASYVEATNAPETDRQLLAPQSHPVDERRIE